jgi:UPF0716 protein FxsA
MIFYLFAIFVVLPLVELTLLLWIGSVTDWRFTLLLVIATGAIGSYLVRRQGVKALQRVQAELRQGSLPAESLADSALIFVAGLLLITPGLITDLLGISLLIPLCRRWYKRRALEWLKSRVQFTSLRQSWTGAAAASHTSQIVDSYVVEDTPDHKLPDGKPPH